MAPPPANISPTSLRATFKEIYGDDFLVACPIEREVMDTFAFQNGEEPGVEFIEAARMTEEQGFSFRQAGTSNITMQNSIALKTEKTKYLPNILEFRSTVDVEAVKRAMSSGRQAFKDTLGMRQEAQRDSVVKHANWTMLNGNRPCGVIAAGGIAAGGNASRKILTLEPASYADAFWACSENMPLDIYDSTSANLSGTAVTRGTVAGSNVSRFRVIAWDPDALKLEVEADTTGDWAAVVAGDCLWRATSYLNEDYGMVGIAASSGQTIFGISQTQYGIWRPVRDLTGGALTMNRILRAVALIHARSPTKARYVARVHPLQWNALNIDLSALRKFDGSYKTTKAENGTGEIEFFSAHGSVIIRGNSFMKRGECLITDDSKWTRRGVSDIDFAFPISNGTEKEYYLVKQDVNAVEFRAYSQQGMYCNMLARNAFLGNLEVPG